MYRKGCYPIEYIAMRLSYCTLGADINTTDPATIYELPISATPGETLDDLRLDG